MPLMWLRDFTPDNELRYISIAHEALADGHWFAFSNHGVPYADKPPLYLWIAMAGYSMFGTGCGWFLGLFSLVPAFVIALVMGRWSEKIIGPAFRTEARLLLLTCGLFCGMTVVLRMDMLMTMWIVLALRCAWQMHVAGYTLRGRIWFALCVFLGVFTKGPMGFLIPLLATTVFMCWKRDKAWHRWAELWHWQVWVVLLGLCALWFGAVWAEGGNSYLDNLLFHQTVGRAVDSFHHKRPFWYYGRSLWYTLLPWTFVIVGGVVSAVRRGRAGDQLERFYQTTVVSILVLLSCISSKIDVYMLPAYPFMVYLGAAWLGRSGASKGAKLSLTLPAVILTTAIVVLWWIAGNKGMEWLGCWQTYAAAALLSAGGVTALVSLWAKSDTRFAVRSIGYALFAAIFVASLAVPSVNDRLGYGTLAREGRSQADALQRDTVYALGLRRAENLDAYIGHRFRVLPDTLSSERLDCYLNHGVIVAGPKVELSSPQLHRRTVGPNALLWVEK